MVFDDSIRGLFSADESDRLQALRDLDSLDVPSRTWLATVDYFKATLAPEAPVGAEERLIAIDVAVAAPVTAVRELVLTVEHTGTTVERVRAAEGLARAADPAASVRIAQLLEDISSRVVRESLAEHLLVADMGSLDDVGIRRLRDQESDPVVRVLLAGTLARVGERPSIRRRELRQLPTDLVTRLQLEDASGAVVPGGSPRGLGGRMRDIVAWTQPREYILAGIQPAVETDATRRLTRGDTPAPSYIVREADPPPPAATLPIPPPGAPVTRFFEGRAPDRSTVGTPVPIQLRVAVEASAASLAVGFELDVPPNGIDLRVVIYAPGFETLSPSLLTLTVPASGDSSWILVDFVAREPGSHTVIASLFHPSGRHLAELPINVTVTETSGRTTQREVRSAVAPLQGESGEISLLIDWIEDESRYRFQIVDASFPPEVFTDRLDRTPRAIVESLVGDLNAFAEGTNVPSDVRAWLRNRGVTLWRNLLPEAVREQFWERRPDIRALRILSRHDPIPWELLYPLDTGRQDDGRFLIEQFPVFRGIRGASPVVEIGKGPLVTVIPGANPPPQALAEIERVRAHWPPGAAMHHLTDLSAISSELAGAHFGVMHFACHNAFDPDDADAMAISFGKERFTPVDLATLEPERTLTPAAPLVFMNACRSGGQAARYTDFGGWARSFMEVGAGAFIGSMWDVRDTSARDFADVFYAQARAGATLSSAVEAARGALDPEHDPTWLAYTIYGDPSAKLVVA